MGLCSLIRIYFYYKNDYLKNGTHAQNRFFENNNRQDLLMFRLPTSFYLQLAQKNRLAKNTLMPAHNYTVHVFTPGWRYTQTHKQP